MKNKLSIIIPTFNRKESLFKLLNCLFSQEDVQAEIIVVDQNPYGFFSHEEEMMLDKTIRILQTQGNPSLARNNGFSHSSADYILFIDDDLLPEKDFCKRGIEVFMKHPDIQCYFPNVFNDAGPEAGVLDARRRMISSLDQEIFEITEAISAAVFYRRSCYEKSGGFDPYLFDFAKAGEDQEFFIRMRRQGLKLWFVVNLSIYHNEGFECGCIMRTVNYLIGG